MIKFKDDIKAHLPSLFEMLLDPVELAVGGELGLVRREGGGILSSRPHHGSIINLLAANMLYLRTDCTAKTQNKYFQKRRCAASVPISTFICLKGMYMYSQSDCLFCCRKICRQDPGNIYCKPLTDT